jgi:hypothetical protein
MCANSAWVNRCACIDCFGRIVVFKICNGHKMGQTEIVAGGYDYVDFGHSNHVEHGGNEGRSY